jgi:hypothetical protein
LKEYSKENRNDKATVDWRIPQWTRWSWRKRMLEVREHQGKFPKTKNGSLIPSPKYSVPDARTTCWKIAPKLCYALRLCTVYNWDENLTATMSPEVSMRLFFLLTFSLSMLFPIDHQVFTETLYWVPQTRFHCGGCWRAKGAACLFSQYAMGFRFRDNLQVLLIPKHYKNVDESVCGLFCFRL